MTVHNLSPRAANRARFFETLGTMTGRHTPGWAKHLPAMIVMPAAPTLEQAMATIGPVTGTRADVIITDDIEPTLDEREDHAESALDAYTYAGGSTGSDRQDAYELIIDLLHLLDSLEEQPGDEPHNPTKIVADAFGRFQIEQREEAR